MSQKPTRIKLSEKGQELVKRLATWLEEHAKSDEVYGREYVEQGHQFLICRAPGLKEEVNKILPDLLTELKAPVRYISFI